MKYRIQHIVASLMMLIFLSYAVGIEVSRHICVEHQSESVALFGKAECPCHHHHKHNEHCSECNTETPVQQEKCCDSHHTHSAENPAISDDCCLELDEVFSIEDSYTPSISEKTIHNFTVLYYLPVETYTCKSISQSTEILNLARDDGNQARRSIIQFLLRNSNPNKSDDLSISLA